MSQPSDASSSCASKKPDIDQLMALRFAPPHSTLSCMVLARRSSFSDAVADAAVFNKQRSFSMPPPPAMAISRRTASFARCSDFRWVAIQSPVCLVCRHDPRLSSLSPTVNADGHREVAGVVPTHVHDLPHGTARSQHLGRGRKRRRKMAGNGDRSTPRYATRTMLGRHSVSARR